jgi:hypothetical protein
VACTPWRTIMWPRKKYPGPEDGGSGKAWPRVSPADTMRMLRVSRATAARVSAPAAVKAGSSCRRAGTALRSYRRPLWMYLTPCETVTLVPPAPTLAIVSCSECPGEVVDSSDRPESHRVSDISTSGGSWLSPFHRFASLLGRWRAPHKERATNPPICAEWRYAKGACRGARGARYPGAPRVALGVCERGWPLGARSRPPMEIASCRRAWSARTRAVMASTMGTARGRTHGSWRPRP